MRPEVLGSPIRFGRCVPSQIKPPDCVTASGIPLWRENTPLRLQPPSARSTTRFQFEPQLRSRPKGSSHRPATATRCATSCAESERSASRSQMFWTLVDPPSQLTLPELCEPLSPIFDQV